MIDSIRRSWTLTSQSIAILRQDKELMLFPILAAILTAVLLVTFAVPSYFLIDWHALERAHAHDQVTNVQYAGGLIVLFAFYFVTWTSMLFCNTAMLHCARMRFNGQNPTLSDGLNAGLAHLGQIAAWAALSATLGIILQQVEERLGFLGGFIRAIVGGAWSIVSFFALPVMIFEDVGPVPAIKRSGQLIQKCWGEGLAAFVGFSAARGLLLMAGIAVFAVGAFLTLSAQMHYAFFGLIGVLILYIMALAVVFGSLSQIFCAALYHYATTGSVAPGYSEEDLRLAYRPK